MATNPIKEQLLEMEISRAWKNKAKAEEKGLIGISPQFDKLVTKADDLAFRFSQRETYNDTTIAIIRSMNERVTFAIAVMSETIDYVNPPC